MAGESEKPRVELVKRINGLDKVVLRGTRACSVEFLGERPLLYLFRVGSGQVIKGLKEGILIMKVGGKRRLYIPDPLKKLRT